MAKGRAAGQWGPQIARSARLPTVIIRPGKPNKAASSFVSGLFREPLQGKDCTIPVPPDTPMASSGYRTVVQNIIHLHDLPSQKLMHDRAVGLPGMNLAVAEMVAAVESHAEATGKVHWEIDEFIHAICLGWPRALDCQRAHDLGFHQDGSLHEIIDGYLQDFADIHA
ncbi:MAG: hypothetical protein AAF352_07210 [Pseudomonadota bacterium]